MLSRNNTFRIVKLKNIYNSKILMSILRWGIKFRFSDSGVLIMNIPSHIYTINFYIFILILIIILIIIIIFFISFIFIIFFIIFSVFPFIFIYILIFISISNNIFISIFSMGAINNII